MKGKRATEAVGRFVAAAMLLVSAPVFAAICVAIALESLLVPAARGPLFFLEERISRGERFRLIKFRILNRDALRSLGDGPTHIKLVELDGDHHLTRVGRVLKRYYLDELPQLINILEGDMALVGTRPWPIELYEAEMATGVTRKRDMPAGLLGPVQAHKGDENSPHGHQLDAEYFEAYKTLPFPRLLALDALIVARCIKVMFEGKGL